MVQFLEYYRIQCGRLLQILEELGYILLDDQKIRKGAEIELGLRLQLDQKR